MKLSNRTVLGTGVNTGAAMSNEKAVVHTDTGKQPGSPEVLILCAIYVQHTDNLCSIKKLIKICMAPGE